MILQSCNLSLERTWNTQSNLIPFVLFSSQFDCFLIHYSNADPFLNRAPTVHGEEYGERTGGTKKIIAGGMFDPVPLYAPISYVPYTIYLVRKI
jgi:hypothetical protein